MFKEFMEGALHASEADKFMSEATKLFYQLDFIGTACEEAEEQGGIQEIITQMVIDLLCNPDFPPARRMALTKGLFILNKAFSTAQKMPMMSHEERTAYMEEQARKSLMKLVERGDMDRLRFLIFSGVDIKPILGDNFPEELEELNSSEEVASLREMHNLLLQVKKQRRDEGLPKMRRVVIQTGGDMSNGVSLGELLRKFLSEDDAPTKAPDNETETNSEEFREPDPFSQGF